MDRFLESALRNDIYADYTTLLDEYEEEFGIPLSRSYKSMAKRIFFNLYSEIREFLLAKRFY
jgi:hypothetical protein